MAEAQRQVSIEWLLETANREMYRLKYSASLVDQHHRVLQSFHDYCKQNAISFYDAGTGIKYFVQRYGISVTNAPVRFTPAQKKTRTTICFLDDIYVFGYAKRYRDCEYIVPPAYMRPLEDYLSYCAKNNGAAGTIRVKKTKLLQFLCFLERRHIELSNVTASDVSDYMSTLFQYSRTTTHIIKQRFEGILSVFICGGNPTNRFVRRCATSKDLCRRRHPRNMDAG